MYSIELNLSGFTVLYKNDTKYRFLSGYCEVSVFFSVICRMTIVFLLRIEIMKML